MGIVLETPTWRASADWGARLGYDIEQIERANRDAIALLADQRARETDGRLPSARSWRGVAAVDAATDGRPPHFMVNCVHLTHFPAPPRGASSVGRPPRRRPGQRVHAQPRRASTRPRSLDPADLAARYRELRQLLPTVRALGGCCGTDHHHIDAISSACATA